MNYWELEKEPWEDEDNYDGARWMTIRGRQKHLESSLKLVLDDSYK